MRQDEMRWMKPMKGVNGYHQSFIIGIITSMIIIIGTLGWGE
jgi:hypothetical protein